MSHFLFQLEQTLLQEGTSRSLAIRAVSVPKYVLLLCMYLALSTVQLICSELWQLERQSLPIGSKCKARDFQ